ncbi:MAG: hypothetical protein ACPLF9_08915 [Methanothermobacter tenebrarum]
MILITMSEKVLEKVRYEVNCVWVVLSVSLGISSLMISDAARSFSADAIFGFGLTIAIVKVLELAVGIFWLLLTLKVMHEFLKIRKKRKYLFRFCGATRGEDEEVSGILRDLIAFYRGYYKEIRVLLIFPFLVGLAMITSGVYAIHSRTIPIEEFVFLLLIGILTLAYSLLTFWYINKKWGQKLLRIKNEEKILSDFLGEAC